MLSIHYGLLNFVNTVFPALALSLFLGLLGLGVMSRGGGPSRPRRNNNRSKQNTSTTVTGTQELAAVSLGTPSGAFLGSQIPLIPTVSPGTRLSNVALQYSQYVIIHSRVTFVTSTSHSSSGRVVMAWTFDSEDPTPPSAFIVNQMAASRQTPVWRNVTSAMPSRSPEKRRYAVISGPDFASLSTEDKQIYLPATFVYGTDGSAQSGLVVGSMIWHYRIKFFNPNASAPETFTSLGTSTQFPASQHRLLLDTTDAVAEEEEQ